MSKVKYIVNPEYINAPFEYVYFRKDGSLDENATMLDGRRFLDKSAQIPVKMFTLTEEEDNE